MTPKSWTTIVNRRLRRLRVRKRLPAIPVRILASGQDHRMDLTRKRPAGVFKRERTRIPAPTRLAAAFLAVACLTHALCSTALLACEQSARPGVKETSDASISGAIRGPSGEPVRGVRITLSSPDPMSHRTAVTGSDGKFVFESLKPGTYTMQVVSAGFEKRTRSDIVVNERTPVVIDFSLARSGTASGAEQPGTASRADASGIPSAAQASTAAGHPNGDHPSGDAPADSGPTSKGLNEFNYYDDAALKPGNTELAVNGGGYSSAREVDSYTLMLKYVDAEGAGAVKNRPVKRTAIAGNEQEQASQTSNGPVIATESAGWSESDFLSRGSGFMLNHQLGASMEAFHAGVTRFPNSAKLHTGLGIVLLSRGEYEKAIATLVRATDLAPSDPQQYFVLAKVCRGANSEVLARLDRLVRLDPHDAQARYWYAHALAMGNVTNEQTFRRIESLLQSAVALDPAYADAHLELGTLYDAHAQYSKAKQEYQLTVRLKPDLAAAHYRLAQVYRRTGERQSAQSELQLYERLRTREARIPQ